MGEKYFAEHNLRIQELVEESKATDSYVKIGKNIEMTHAKYQKAVAPSEFWNFIYGRDQKTDTDTGFQPRETEFYARARTPHEEEDHDVVVMANDRANEEYLTLFKP